MHVLENNEGLLERDYAQNKPFYDRFGIKSSTDLADDEADVTYCLKVADARREMEAIGGGSRG